MKQTIKPNDTSCAKRNVIIYYQEQKESELSLNVDEEDNSINIKLVVQTAVRFGIEKSDAEAYVEDILKIVRDNWEKLAARYGLTRRQIEEMRPAFSTCYE